MKSDLLKYAIGFILGIVILGVVWCGGVEYDAWADAVRNT